MRELAILAVVLILLGVLGRLINRRDRRRARAVARSGSRWHGVAVSPSQGACERVRQLWNIRFLSKDAPRLPLDGCDARPCRCHFLHYADRRTEERRSLAGGRLPPLANNADRRQAPRRCVSPFSH